MPRPDELTRRAFLERSVASGLALGVFGGDVARVLSRPVFSDTLTLENEAIRGVWSVADGRLRAVELLDRETKTKLSVPPQAFALTLADGTRLESTSFRIIDTPVEEALTAMSSASRLAGRTPGRRVSVILEDSQRRVKATWRAELRDGSRYLRQEIVLHE